MKWLYGITNLMDMSLSKLLKEISPEYSLEGLMLKLKLQCFGHLMWTIGSLKKTLILGKIKSRRQDSVMILSFLSKPCSEVNWERLAQLRKTVLPMNIQDWFHLGLIGLISMKSKGLSKSLLQHHSWKASILRHSAFFMVNSYVNLYMTIGKTIALTRWTWLAK